MNHKNLNSLIDWLERGAPEVVFSMNYGLRTLDEATDYDGGFEFELPQSELNKFESRSCGSVCCIAGAAAQFDGVPVENDYDWNQIQSRALKYLGLPPTSVWMLPVFDPDYAPEACTPKQAAQALKLWAEHAETDIEFNPWPKDQDDE